MLRVCGEVQLAADDPGFGLHRAISAIAKPIEDRVQVGHHENRRARVTRERLSQIEIRSVGAKIPTLQHFKRSISAPVIVSAWVETFDGVDDQVQLIELFRRTRQKISVDALRGGPKHRLKLLERDRLTLETTARGATQNHLLNRFVPSGVEQLQRRLINRRRRSYRRPPLLNLIWRDQTACRMDLLQFRV